MAVDQDSAIAIAQPTAPGTRSPADWPVSARLVQPTSAMVCRLPRPRIRRLESHWFAVMFYTETSWDHCG
jgi:hypothetical protein